MKQFAKDLKSHQWEAAQSFLKGTDFDAKKNTTGAYLLTFQALCESETDADAAELLRL